MDKNRKSLKNVSGSVSEWGSRSQLKPNELTLNQIFERKSDLIDFPIPPDAFVVE